VILIHLECFGRNGRVGYQPSEEKGRDDRFLHGVFVVVWTMAL